MDEIYTDEFKSLSKIKVNVKVKIKVNNQKSI